ncbi:MAG: tRNA pseudouridine(38-40) synthase TruA [Pseudomonadales bacterium]
MRVALGVEYDGGAFNGYQQQLQVPSVQETLQIALSQIADEPIQLAAAGRTDAGVHATGQVVAFETAAERPPRAWLDGVNSLLPATLNVHWARTVETSFHPRFDATARRYMYLFYEDARRSTLLDAYAVRSQPLDDDAMHRCAAVLVGEHDFSTFRAAGCQSRSPFRCVHRIAIHRFESFVVIDITANAFLLHMVRNIAGALWQVGQGRGSLSWIRELMRAGDRSRAPATAPARGLYLVDVRYPHEHLPGGRLPGLLRALGSLDRF